MSWPRPRHAPLSPVVKTLFCVSQEFHFLLTSGLGCPKRTLQHKDPLFIKRPNHPHDFFSYLVRCLSVITFTVFSNFWENRDWIDRRVGCKSDAFWVSKSKMTEEIKPFHNLQVSIVSLRGRGLIVITTQVGISVEEGDATISIPTSWVKLKQHFNSILFF